MLILIALQPKYYFLKMKKDSFYILKICMNFTQVGGYSHPLMRKLMG